jgi:cellobiose phosphorylase
VLEERVAYLHTRDLRAEEEAYYDRPTITEEQGTVYEHCLRAIERSLQFGTHGLPLMGGGDWNDGMNLVGAEGRGESVWLAFFLFEVLNRFADLAEQRGDVVTADRYAIAAGLLRGNVEESAWDGDWYLRAWFDDGTPLGSATSATCRIDSISQSWSVLSGAASHARASTALESVNRLLVSDQDRLIRLLEPPFDSSSDPGYIRGYAPGVRENGGQYTHAAIWTAMASAALGKHQRGWELFQLINPFKHGSTPEGIAIYRIEPYVVAADVYGVAPHIGRGGWSWYTGSAAWMYRLLLESLLGLDRQGTTLVINPHLACGWDHATIHYRYHETTYHISVHRPSHGVGAEGSGQTITLDGVAHPEASIALVNDQRDHTLMIELG